MKQFSALFSIVWGLVLAAGALQLGQAQTCEKPGGYPERPLTMIVPYGPGGGSGQSGRYGHRVGVFRGDVCSIGVVFWIFHAGDVAWHLPSRADCDGARGDVHPLTICRSRDGGSIPLGERFLR